MFRRLIGEVMSTIRSTVGRARRPHVQSRDGQSSSDARASRRSSTESHSERLHSTVLPTCDILSADRLALEIAARGSAQLAL